jgi:hypothetical protein
MEAAGGELHGGHATEHMGQPVGEAAWTPAEEHAGAVGDMPGTDTPEVDTVTPGQQPVEATRPIGTRSVEAAGYDSAAAIDRIRDIALDLLRENGGSFHISQLVEARTGKAHPGRRRKAGIVEKIGVIADMGTVEYKGKGRYAAGATPEPAPQPVAPAPKEQTVRRVVIEPEQPKPKTRPRNLDEMIAAAGLRRDMPRKPGRRRSSYMQRRNDQY